ncbi:MAG: two-component sensor histidine kinase [Desulfobacteraceae bacterium]|nr:two-component sensor histidine kinase [Desulfobacteraceae bacterium]
MSSEGQQTGRAYYGQLRRNIIITMITVSFTPMLLVIAILLFQFSTSYHEKTYAHLEEMVQKHKQNIDTFLSEKLANIRFLVASTNIETLTDKSFLQAKLQQLQEEYGDVFVDMGVVDETGKQLSYAGPYELHNVRYLEADWFKRAINRDFFISDVFMGLRGSPHFIITVRRQYEPSVFILRATIDFRAFNTLVENLRVGETGHAFILNKEGRFQTRPAVEEARWQNSYDYFVDRMEDSKRSVEIIERPDGSGAEHLYAIAELKGGDWLLIFKQETGDAFEDISRVFRISGIIFLLGGSGIVMTVIALTRRMVRRIMKADKEKEKLNQQMIEAGKLASVGELAAGIAHEINNPVAIMVEEAGWIEDLLEEEEFAESENLSEFQRALRQIGTQGRRCKEITHKLLSFARKTDTTVKDVQLNDLIREIVDLSAQMARYNKVTITTEFQPDLPYVTLSPAEMQQVMLNLINNAIDAMGNSGGTIHIATKLSRLEKDHIVITVEDNGPGIPESNLSRIFDPFFTTKPVGKGTGLGLSICYGIVQKNGGNIDVHSTVGKGTRFRVWIPFQKPGNPGKQKYKPTRSQT